MQEKPQHGTLPLSPDLCCLGMCTLCPLRAGSAWLPGSLPNTWFTSPLRYIQLLLWPLGAAGIGLALCPLWGPDCSLMPGQPGQPWQNKRSPVPPGLPGGALTGWDGTPRLGRLCGHRLPTPHSTAVSRSGSGARLTAGPHPPRRSCAVPRRSCL